MGIEKRKFLPFDSTTPIGDDKVEADFCDIYTETYNTSSMQAQLFALIDKYNASDQPIRRTLGWGADLTPAEFAYVGGGEVGHRLRRFDVEEEWPNVVDQALSSVGLAAQVLVHLGPPLLGLGPVLVNIAV